MAQRRLNTRARYFGSTSVSLGCAPDAPIAQRGAEGLLDYLLWFVSASLCRFVDDGECASSAISVLEVSRCASTSTVAGVGCHIDGTW